MFEKKRNSIIKVIIILLILVSVNVFINIPFVSAGRWRYQTTVEDIYNITQSSDDAIVIIDNSFSSTGETITLKINIYELIVGLRFDNISIPWNATHQYRVSSAYLSLYSDYEPLSYELESEKVSIYFERDNYDIQTFTNYTEMISRVPSYNYRNWDLDDVHGNKWNDSPNINVLVNGATGFDNDTICFLIYSDRGIWFRYFNTIDSFVDYAPRLHIISQIYEYEETPPSGYEDAEFVETYRGFDIWNVTTGGWMNYLDWNEIDASNKIDVLNSSYVNIGTQFSGSIIANLNNDTRGKYITGEWKFGMMISLVSDSEIGGKVPIIYYHALGHPNYKAGFRDYLGGPDDALGFGISDYDDDTSGRFYFCLETITGGARYCAWSPNYYEVNSTRWYWVHIQYDTTYQNYFIDIYNDFEMTDLEVHINRTAYAHINVNGYDWEYSVIGLHYAGWDCYLEGALKTTINILEWVVTDEDGTVIVTLDIETHDLNDVRVWIDNYLGASSEYDKTPWMGDFTLLLIGLVGVAFIPLGFLIFVSSVRDGDIIGGLQTLVLMFFIGIGCIITWLWA